MMIEEIISNAEGKTMDAYVYSFENDWIKRVTVPDPASFHALMDQSVIAVEIIDQGDVYSTYIRTGLNSWKELKLIPEYTKNHTAFTLHLHTLALNLLIKEFDSWTTVRKLLLDDLARQEKVAQFNMAELRLGSKYFLLPIWANLYRLTSMDASIRESLIEWFFQNYPVFL